MYLLEMTDIDKSFPGVKALDKAQLKVKKGSVHALMGENGAGKSTLMKCLFGIYKKDNGIIKINGKEVNFSGAKDAMENGVAMVHQELNQVLKRDVMDNLWLGRYPKNNGFVSQNSMLRMTKAVFDDLGISVNPKAVMGNLSISKRQMVEIAKAVSYNASILVLDEPTSSLTEIEVKHLFSIINRLKEKGCGIIYISHKMEEILEIADEVTIMRDGKYVSTDLANTLTTETIIKKMVGRELTNRFPPHNSNIGDELLKVENLSGLYCNVEDVSFSLKKGEILGIAGLVGSRRTEVLELIFGLSTKKSGTFYLEGNKIDNNNPQKAIKNKFAMITEERRATGIFSVLNIKENSTISNISNYKGNLFLNNKSISSASNWVVKNLGVKTPSLSTQINTLSGGNQQKVIIGRWLLTKPKILLLDEPTRGIDVGAKYDIYVLINNFVNENNSVIVVSSEMSELMGICDRIMVMSNGKLAGIVNAKTCTQEQIMSLASKFI